MKGVLNCNGVWVLMRKEHILVNEIITDHRERMLNLKKYYPFFELAKTSFSWFMEGRYEDRLDMGYIIMAVLRFFIEENNFKEREVTYPEYATFMKSCILRDFGIVAGDREYKELTDFVFDKLKNDGRPFSFVYYDPVDRIKKTSRVRLLESRIEDGVVWYSISPEGIEFYLDTKEIRDESRISVEQLLLEKMIKSKDFKGGTEVVRRINEEVKRLRIKKNQVMELLTTDIFAGLDSYKEFFNTGIKWFDEEQKLFVKNKELIETALKRTENDINPVQGESFRTGREIHRLDTELKVAMNNHSERLKACTELGIKADEIIKKGKLTRLRTRFDFKGIMNRIIKEDRTDILEYIAAPFFMLNIKKTFDVGKVEDLLSYRPENEEKPEKKVELTEKDIVFEDELDERRFNRNTRTLFLILLRLLKEKKTVMFTEYNERVRNILSDKVLENGDYYTFLIHLCEKKEYVLEQGEASEDTFLDAMIKEYMNEPEFSEFIGMHFYLELAGGEEEEIETSHIANVTNFRIILV